MILYICHVKDLKYLAAYTIPLACVISFMSNGVLTYSAVIYAFVVIPVMELIVGEDNVNLSEEDITIEAKRVIEKSEDFVKVVDDMYVIDLGQISITAFNEGDDRSFMKKEVGNSVRLAMQLGQRIKALVTSQKFGSIMASGASLGMKPSLSQKYFNLTIMR